MQSSTNHHIEQRVALLAYAPASPALQSRDLPFGRKPDPVKRLMGALLRQAIADFRDNVATRARRKKHRFRKAKDWIFDEAGTGLFSFENICGTLGLDPDYLRGGLLLSSARKLGTR